MSKLKDKLSASVRMAKAAQQPAAKGAPARPVAKPAAPAAAKPSPAPAKPAAAPAAKPATPKTASAGGIPESGTALFPERVWPD
jgi:hypothetical protein